MTHLRLIGVTLLDPTLLRDIPLLQDLTLDMASYVRSAKNMYSEEDAIHILQYLDEGGAKEHMRHLRISVCTVGLDLLHEISKRLPRLETLHLVGEGAGPYLPVTTQYATEATDLMVRFHTLTQTLAFH